MKECVKEESKKLHYRLALYIQKTGTKTPKPKHGNYWNVEIDGINYHLDNYSTGIKIGDYYIGMDFGGFEPRLSIKMYKKHIGILYQYWLKNRSNYVKEKI